MNHDSRSFEDDLSSLKADVAVIRSNYMTKADLQEVRVELKGGIQAVRTELTKEILGSRAELDKALHAQTLRMYGFGALLQQFSIQSTCPTHSNRFRSSSCG